MMVSSGLSHIICWYQDKKQNQIRLSFSPVVTSCLTLI